MSIILNICFKSEFWKEHVSTKRRVDIVKLHNKRELRQWLASCFRFAVQNVPLDENLHIQNIHFTFWSNGGLGRITFHREPLGNFNLREIRQIMTEHMRKVFENIKEIKLDEIHNSVNFLPGPFQYFVKVNEPPTSVTLLFSDTLVHKSVERDFEDQHYEIDDDDE